MEERDEDIPLRIDIQNINPETHPNSYIRLNAVCEVLEGEGIEETAEKWKVGKTSIKKWRDMYSVNSSIDSIINMENLPLKTTYISKYRNHIGPLLVDLMLLDIERYPNTKKRADSIYLVFTEESNAKGAKQVENVVESTVRTWVDVYVEKGMNGLKKMEGHPLSRTREASVVDKLIADFEDVLKNLDEKVNPLGKIKADIILKVLKKENHQNEVLGYNLKTIGGWITSAKKSGAEAFLLKVQNFHQNKKMVSENAKSNVEWALSLESDLAKLDVETHPRTHERGAIMLSVIKEGKNKKGVAVDKHIVDRVIYNWIKIYKEKGINGIIAFENRPLRRNKKPKPKKKNTNVAKLPTTNNQDFYNSFVTTEEPTQKPSSAVYKTTGLDLDDPSKTSTETNPNNISREYSKEETAYLLSLESLAAIPPKRSNEHSKNEDRGDNKRQKKKDNNSLKICAV